MNLARFLIEDEVVKLRDTDGRPVSEATSPCKDCPPCPYNDQRHGLPMNLAALRQLVANWEDILYWISPQTAEQSSLRDSLAVALLATVQPAVYAIENPESSVPAGISARYKACLGFCQILTYMIWNDPNPDSAKLGDYGNSDEFFQWLDEEGWLIGQIQACPGPRTMIDQLFTRFCSAQLAPEQVKLSENTVEIVALQSVHVLANHQAENSLASRLLQRGQAPWIFALVQNPRRDPGEVTKLFEQGQIPRSVKQLLKDPADVELFLRLCTQKDTLLKYH